MGGRREYGGGSLTWRHKHFQWERDLLTELEGEVGMVSLDRGIKGRWVSRGDPVGSTRLSQGTKCNIRCFD